MKNAATKRAPQQPLSTSDATDFLIKYKEAWETHNADLAAGLFTRDAGPDAHARRQIELECPAAILVPELQLGPSIEQEEI